MNFNSVFDNFPSWEKQFKQIQENDRQNTENNRRNEFVKKYPNINFDNLINLRSLQTNDGEIIMTNDGCDHYVDKKTNKIYSYDYHFNKCWRILPQSSQDELLNIYGYHN
jgi:hypothetical protein